MIIAIIIMIIMIINTINLVVIVHMNTEDDMEKEDEDGETLRPKVKLGYVTP